MSMNRSSSEVRLVSSSSAASSPDMAGWVREEAAGGGGSEWHNRRVVDVTRSRPVDSAVHRAHLQPRCRWHGTTAALHCTCAKRCEGEVRGVCSWPDSTNNNRLTANCRYTYHITITPLSACCFSTLHTSTLSHASHCTLSTPPPPLPNHATLTPVHVFYQHVLLPPRVLLLINSHTLFE